MANRNLLVVFGGTEEGGSDYNRLQDAFSQAQLDAQNTDVIQFNFLFGKPKTPLPPSPIVAYRAAGSGNPPEEMLTRDVTVDLPSGIPFVTTQGPDVYAVNTGILPAVTTELLNIETLVKQTNWTLLGFSNSSTSGMQFGVHQGFADRAYDLVSQFLATSPNTYDNISTIGHSRGVSLTARFAGKFQDDARFKRAVLLDPVSKNNDDDAIVGDSRDAVQQLSKKGKEVHIVSKTKDSGFDYEAYIAELVGTKYYHLPTSKTAGISLNANPESRIDTSLGNEPDMRNVFVHQALMQHGYMLQGATGFENGKPFTGLPTNFGAYQRIINPAPWTGTYYNGEEINIDQMAQSAWLTGYVRGLHSADRASTITQKFNPLSLIPFSTVPPFTTTVTHHKLSDSDPLSKYYNAFEIDDAQNQRDRRHAFVHALAYKTLIPTVELSINRTESVEAREAEVTITATSNRVFNTPQRVKLKPSVGTATEGVDFTSLPASREIIIPANEKSGSISFNVKDDGLIETPDETVTFEIDPNGVFHDTPLVPGGIQGLVKTGKESATFKIIDDDKAGLKIEQSNGFTEVAEGVGGKTDTYTVALTSEPSAPVTVTLTPDAQVNMAPATLTFDSSNWKTPQTVTVTAVTDGLEALNHTGSITHTMAGGADYTGLAPVPLAVKVIDDQVVNIELEETEGSTQIWESEDVFGGVMDDGPKGVVDTYTIKLNQAPAAGETVTITFTTDAQLDAIAPLTFDPSNWSEAQTVSVKAINDQDLEDFFHTGLITHAASSSDPASPFNGAPVRDVNVTIQDDETPTVTIVESGGSTEVSEDGKTDTYTLVLDSKPKKDVTIEFDTDVQLEEIASITFTPANWNQPQTVTVKAVDDGDFEELIHDSEIFHFISSDDPEYDDRFVPDVTVKIAENDILTPPPPPPSVVPPAAPETKPGLVVTDLLPGVTPNSGAPGSEEQPITVPDGQPEPLILQAKSTKDAVRTLRLDNPGDAPLVLDRLTFSPSLTNFPPGLTGNDIFIFSLSQNPIPPGGKADLVIRLRDDLPPGEYAGIFSALTNLPGTDAVYNFPLRATVSLPLAREVAEANRVPALDPFPETAGDDEIFGSLFDGDGPQWLNGSLGDDLINGNLGNDVLTGGPGNDVVHGGRGDDFIRGALGDDVLFGDLGNDTLIGGLGRDRFVLGAGDGSDLILDFEVGIDSFLLKPELTFEQLGFVAAGNSTRIEFNGELLATVVGVPTPVTSAAGFGPLS